EDEANDHKIVRGALAMANAGPNDRPKHDAVIERVTLPE
ncbi:MAG: hypothetical protein QOG52_1955, partial [Frankiaceae bacterium]|nr:hypothetical protein [Frankiaceae bacterium]